MKSGEAKADEVHRTEFQRTGGQTDSSGALQRVHSEFPLSTDHQCMPVRKRCMAGQRATCQVQKTESWKPHSTRNISCSPNPGWKILSFIEHEESNYQGFPQVVGKLDLEMSYTGLTCAVLCYAVHSRSVVANSL